METIAVVDFETTGLGPTSGGRATEVAAVLVRQGEVVDAWSSLMNSGTWVPPHIQALTGISNEMLASAPPSADVMAELARFTAGCPLVAHNASFDRSFWQAEMQRAGIAPDPAHEFACTVLLSRRLWPEAGSHALGALVRFHALSFSGRALRARPGRHGRGPRTVGHAAAHPAQKPAPRPCGPCESTGTKAHGLITGKISVKSPLARLGQGQSRPFVPSVLLKKNSMSVIQVRPATLRDAKAIAEIHVAASQDAYKALLPAAALDAMSVQKRQAFWREAIDLCEPQVIVAHLDNKIMGFAGFDRSRDKGTPATTGEVWALFASPEHWDKGVGLALWDATRDGLQEEGCTKATLWCYLRNERALRFFELAGFKRELGSARTTEVGGSRVEEIRLFRSLV